MRPTSSAILVVLSLSCGCAWNDRTSDIASALRELLAAEPPASANAAVWTDVREFYTRREGAPAWVDYDDTAKAEEALQVLRQAQGHGLEPGDYGEHEVVRLLGELSTEDSAEGEDGDRARQLATLDARMTIALLTLGRDVALGRTKPEPIDSRWKPRRTPPDFVGTLAASADKGLGSWLDTVRPRHPEYAALQKALADLHAQKVNGDASVGDRIARFGMNLERWRWLPDDLGSRSIVVNIPSYHLTVRENGAEVLQMKVIVGKPENKTPIFSAQMSSVVFSPYWNVPDSIVEGETAPAAARDPNFLARNNIEILRLSKQGGIPVDPSTIDWDDPEELKRLAFRQKPGAKNALGHVKFLFPNEFDVYLHDTPADQLFARPGRAFSHGCVRVEQPESLAQWVLKDQPEWDDARILEAMHAGVEKHVKLKGTIPVHIVYFTTWVDGSGGVHYEPDVYGYDARQSSQQGHP